MYRSFRDGYAICSVVFGYRTRRMSAPPGTGAKAIGVWTARLRCVVISGGSVTARLPCWLRQLRTATVLTSPVALTDSVSMPAMYRDRLTPSQLASCCSVSRVARLTLDATVVHSMVFIRFPRDSILTLFKALSLPQEGTYLFCGRCVCGGRLDCAGIGCDCTNGVALWRRRTARSAHHRRAG